MTEETPDAPDRLAGPVPGRRPWRRSRPLTPNARFTAPAGQCPVDRARVGEPGRRADLRHPVRRPSRHRRAARSPKPSTGSTACSWARRVASEGTAAAASERRRAAPRPVRDAALLRLQHGRLLRALAARSGTSTDAAKLPRIYFVNWFRKDETGKFIWPGFGENSRVLEWIVERLEGKAAANDTAIGRVPAKSALDISGLGLTDEQMDTLLGVDHEIWRDEASKIPSSSKSSANASRPRCGPAQVAHPTPGLVGTTIPTSKARSTERAFCISRLRASMRRAVQMPLVGGP